MNVSFAAAALDPRNVVSKSLARQGELLDNILRFQAALQILIDRIDHEESEENAKNHVRDFLTKVWYQDHVVNTYNRVDLVIHREDTADSPIRLLIEAKRPANKAEFPKNLGYGHDLRCKALYECLYYYLELRTEGQNEISHIVITNGLDWYIIDENAWADLVYSDKKLRADFEHYAQEKRTDQFYTEIAKPFFDHHFTDPAANPLPFVYVDLRVWDSRIKQALSITTPDQRLEREITLLYKLFSPQHLLKLSFQNTGNQLDTGFYRELLHILGLREELDATTGKLLINRLPTEEREPGSLLENAISQLKAENLLNNLSEGYGKNTEERLFNAGMELVITWLNRILFLKLLEAQLRSYHTGESAESADYAFLAPNALADYDELNTLFFKVLAVMPHLREVQVRRWAHIPYLNSTLFEPSELERRTLRISNLNRHSELTLFSSTILKDREGRRLPSGQRLKGITYLLQFLDAYNFASEGGGDIQRENKSLISAKVLGLFFEKINGYQDGSIYTPGYITEYMCRISIRERLVERFNAEFDVHLGSWTELLTWAHNNLYKTDMGDRARSIIQTLTICDPAVGSGHFLVSALNELMACQSELGILQDDKGISLPVEIAVSDDELVITYRSGEAFEYKARSLGQSLRIQKALFHQKQAIIENCLFGVDINPNSVKICRLRLWIELLKQAYYENGQLQTLPNIDINIKEGNSLISRIPLKAELVDPKLQRLVNDYRIWVQEYKNTTDREIKYGLELRIRDSQAQLREPLRKTDPRRKKLAQLSSELFIETQPRILDTPLTAKQKEERNKRIQNLENQYNALKAELDAEDTSALYARAFEWRFAFPEVLDEHGDFIGFDLVIGNPPYIRQEELGDLKKPLARDYPDVFAGTADIYQYFFQLGLRLSKPDGQMGYIVANKWMLAAYGEALRRYLSQQTVLQVVDFGDLKVFDAATTYPCIIRIKPIVPAEDHQFPFVKVDRLKYETTLEDYVLERQRNTVQAKLSVEGWNLSDQQTRDLLEKIKTGRKTFREVYGKELYIGVKTGFNEAFILSREEKVRLEKEDRKSKELIHPFIMGKDIKRYSPIKEERFIIFTDREVDINRYKAIKKHLENWTTRLTPKKSKEDKYGRKPGKYEWFHIQDTVKYHQKFLSPKIVFPDIALNSNFTLDKTGSYIDMTCFFIESQDLFLLGYLNSKLVRFFFQNISSSIRGGYLRWKRLYIYQIPIIEPDAKTRTKLEKLVDQVMAAKEDGKDTTALEAKIDALVYQLYGLTEDEIKLIEGF